MSDSSSRPDTIEGISTDPDATPGDPELRTVNAAPDLSDDSTDASVAEDVHDIPGDATPGTAHDPS